jgi:hypothetical protein
MLVVDADGFLARPEELHFNDAAWLANKEQRMLHPDILQRGAELLGVRSLRYFHQVAPALPLRLFTRLADLI